MGFSLDEIRKRYERYKKKKEFIRRLKKGKPGTDDPGPMRVTGSTGAE
jgi:hypothetical protein